MDIQTLILDIIHTENPHVFSVDLIRKDHSLNWTAIATLRADDRTVSVAMADPVDALIELKKLVAALVCPTCHQYIQG